LRDADPYFVLIDKQTIPGAQHPRLQKSDRLSRIIDRNGISSQRFDEEQSVHERNTRMLFGNMRIGEYPVAIRRSPNARAFVPHDFPTAVSKRGGIGADDFEQEIHGVGYAALSTDENQRTTRNDRAAVRSRVADASGGSV
jgi:hypothetical protein